MHVAVIGAGAFGGWTALHLLRRGSKVTLLDAWGAGHSRASSGGETRIIRCAYGNDNVSARFAKRAFELWRESEREWHYCPACYRDVPTFRFSEGVVGSGEPVSVIRCCWECGYGIDRLAETDPERVHELVRQREALGAEESS